MISKREAAIISVYTGIALGEFHETHKLIEELIGRPVLTHELAKQQIWDKLKRLSKPLFMVLEVEK